MNRKKTSDFDGIASLRSQDVPDGRQARPRALVVTLVCLIVLGAIVAAAALAAAAVLAVPILFGLTVLHT